MTGMTTTLGALLCAVLAVLIGVRRPAARDLDIRLDQSPTPRRRLGRRAALTGAAVLAGATVLIGSGQWAGPSGAVAALAGLIVFGVTGWLLRERRRDRKALLAQVDVAHACEVLASHLRVGQVPTEAMTQAARDCPVLREAQQVHDVGGDVLAVWRAQARRPGHAGLLELARAWQVSLQTGAPLSSTLDQVATSLASEESLRAVVAGELASPRATSKVMAALPACGIGLGYLLGGSPIQWLFAGPAGWACVLGGVLLAAAGVIWIEVLARQTADPPAPLPEG